MRYQPPVLGAVRICPRCGGRNKALLARCAGCGTGLGTSPGVTRAALWWPRPTALPRAVRIALVFGVLLALLAGLYVRRTFRVALAAPAEVAADGVIAPPPPVEVAGEPVPDSELTYVPMARGTTAPLVVPPAGLAGVPPVPPEERAAVSETAEATGGGMMSMTPSPTRRRVLGEKRAFTNDDLDALRASEPRPPAAPSPDGE